MYNHYNLWGGRITAHSLLQSALIFNKNIFNVINSLVFVGLALLIYMHSVNNRKINLSLIIGIILSMWFFIPQFGLTVLWASGAANYLWCSFIIVLMLLPFRRYIDNHLDKKDSLAFSIYMFVLGLFAGWTNENTGGAMILLMMFFLFYYKINKIKIPKWAICGFISSCISFILLAVAPGNSARTAHLVNKNVNIVENLSKVLEMSIDLTIVPFILLLIVLILFLLTNRNKSDIRKHIILTVMYVLSALAGMVVLAASPQTPSRTWFGPIIFIIIAIANLYQNIKIERVEFKYITAVILTLFVVKFAIGYSEAYKDINTTYTSVNNQIELIEEGKENGNLDIKVKQHTPAKSKYNAFLGTRYLSDNKDSWLNVWMAKYYGVSSIVMEEENNEK